MESSSAGGYGQSNPVIVRRAVGFTFLSATTGRTGQVRRRAPNLKGKVRLGIIEPDRLESPYPGKILTTANSVPKRIHPKISGTAEEPGNPSRPPDRRGLGMLPSLYDGLVGRARAPVVPWPDLQIVAPSGKGPCSGNKLPES